VLGAAGSFPDSRSTADAAPAGERTDGLHAYPLD
jgi:hypothetical protein